MEDVPVTIIQSRISKPSANISGKRGQETLLLAKFAVLGILQNGEAVRERRGSVADAGIRGRNSGGTRRLGFLVMAEDDDPATVPAVITATFREYGYRK